jgi:hypothetical protein
VRWNPGPGRSDDERIHVFDQTNGILDPASTAGSDRRPGAVPPHTFGVPPLTSL